MSLLRLYIDISKFIYSAKVYISFVKQKCVVLTGIVVFAKSYLMERWAIIINQVHVLVRKLDRNDALKPLFL